MPFRPRLRHLLWIIAAFLIFKIYMVREIVAAFVLFAGIFAVVALISATVWLIQFVGVQGIAWSETWLRGLRAAGARGALVYAEITRKSQRGETAP